MTVTTKSHPTRYKTIFTNGNVTSYSDNTSEKGGHGDGFRPHELIEAALANCISMSIRMYADEHALALDSVSTTVSIDRRETGQVCLQYDIKPEGNLSPAERDELMNLAESCPVRRTLSSEISFQRNGA
ncbi:OsmC family protein [Vibrio quintilis]|uniref:Peroxiredoxin OsmC n=1 Tax=Vibrio quintilis TaxID=1117707 RepID=A0A1M7YVI7_9VIBR|nr:OsmC family protein [Vibrio quintilis]SHO56654.1 Peroxiredoxin OsmC [Vibrio quintilis]